MAVMIIKLLYLSSVFLLIAAAAGDDDSPRGQCLDGGGGDLAGRMKESLVRDLVDKLPGREKTYYCNMLTQDRLQMYGFVECVGRDSAGAESMKACTDCLTLVGGFLIGNCGETGAGFAWDMHSVCYFKVGYSIDVCPKGTY